MKKDILSNKQEAFVQNLILGMSQREAYKKAYGANYSDNAIDTKASQLLKKDKVKNRYEELLKKVKEQTEETTIMSAKERMEWLTDIIKDNTKEIVVKKSKKGKIISEAEIKVVSPTDTKLRAVEILNKMTGEYKTKIEGSVNVEIRLEDVL